jgi:putative redox protein
MMSEESIRFTGAEGNQLVGRIARPKDSAPRAWALFAHCFTCGKSSAAAARISRALAERGFGVLRFDFTGLGESEGDFADTNFTSNIEDLVAAADWLRDHEGPARVLIGHSLGGTAVLAAAPRIEECVAVATIGAPARADHVEHLLGDSSETILREGEAEVDLGGRPFTIRRQFVEDVRAHALPASVRELRRALLVLHSPRDAIVDVDNAAELFRHALHPKSFVSLDRADHLLSDAADARYAAEVIAAWASKYLPDDVARKESTDHDGDQPGVGVHGRTRTGGLRTELSVAGHRMIADEPKSVGGTGEGPTPYDLLGAALAACTGMTLQMYLAHKKWPAADIGVTVRHDHVHAKDCADCETKSGKIDRFRRTLRICGELDAGQRARLLEIADKCPVHRTLNAEVRIETELSD